MDESDDNLCSEDMKSTNSPLNSKTKPKKRSLIERELETNLTARITSPVSVNDGSNTSRYGRARRFKSQTDQPGAKQVNSETKSPLPEKSPAKPQNQSPVYKMHASNTPQKKNKSPIKIVEKFIDNQIENIYQENKSLSRFGNEDDKSLSPSPGKKYPKVYIRKDLIQKREPEDTVMVIQNMFSPVKSGKKSTSTHLNNILERSCERYSLNEKQQNGYLDNSSVVKTLDFDGRKKKKEIKDKSMASKGELFDLEAQCPYQVGDLAWARMGTYPFWPSIITRDPNGMFVKKKLFGRIERDVIHVTFFGDNGRRSWIVDNMLRMYHGLLEFECTRDNFTPQDKKKDPKLYAAYFISEKKQALWNTSVEEAEALLKEPKRLRIDIFNDMLMKSRSNKMKQPKSKMSRTDSDVSLSESLYDSLFSEDDGKSDNNDKSKRRSRNKSLDMIEVVTACLDNMAAKTGITKIQRQSHMDIWLQKAKSKTPEKNKTQMQAPVKKLEDKKDTKVNNIKKNTPVKRTVQKGYSLRKKVNVTNDLNGYENGHAVKNRKKVLNKEVFSQEPDSLGIIIKAENQASKPGDNVECPVDMNTSCESETFTDKSVDSTSIINSTNNNTIDETSELEKSQSKSNDSSINQNEIELISNCKNIELVKNNIKDVKRSRKCKTDLDINFTPSEIEDKTQESQMSIDITDIDDENSENISKLENLSKSQDLNNQDITDSTNSTESLNLDKPSGIDSVNESANKEDNHILGFQGKLSDAMVSNNQDNHEFQDHSNTTSNITPNSDNTDVSAPSQNEKNRISTNNDTKVKDDKQNASKYLQNFESSTPNIKDKCIAILEDCIMKKNEDFDVDNMSVDEDSDSERLPYSPLSNLGNNSDDNLDDIPFIDGNVSEMESQTPVIVNGFSDSTYPNLINSKTIVQENLCKVDFQSKHMEMPDTLKNKIKMYNNNFTDKHLNGDIGNCVNENIDNKAKELENGLEMKRSKEVITHEVKENSEETLCNGYNGQNVRELNLKTKEVRIYVSDCVPTSVKENEHSHKTSAKDVEPVSNNSEDSVFLSKLDSKRTLRSQKENQRTDHYNNPDFVKYMELRQDALLDENPELNEDEVKTYLYKTWLYEQNVKSDVIKNDELRECYLVKGLNQVQGNTPPRKKLSLKKKKLSKPTTDSGTLKMFLRRKKDTEQHDSDEICFERKRGVKKNMIKDDGDDDFDSNKNEWHIMPVKEKNDTCPPLSPDESKELNEIQNLPNGDVIESIKEAIPNKDLSSAKVTVESDATPSIVNTEKVTVSVSTTQGEIGAPESSGIVIRDSPVELNEKTEKDDFDKDSIKSDDSEPLIKCTRRSKTKTDLQEESINKKVEDVDTISLNSEESEASVIKRRKKLNNKKVENGYEDPAFIKYLELRQDAVIDEHPELSQNEIVAYLYQTWLYEENIKSDIKKTDEIEQSTMVKGLKDPVQQTKKIRRKVPKQEKDTEDDSPSKPKRKSVKPFYNEEYSDIEEELEVFEIFKPRSNKVNCESSVDPETQSKEEEVYNEIELYFAELSKPKPNIFKGLIREKVCEICEKIGNLVKCKGCNGMFHIDCVKKQTEVVEGPAPTPKGRKKKKKLGPKNKNSDELDDHDMSEDNNVSLEEILEAGHTVNEDVFESHLSTKMQELLDTAEKVDYDSYSSDDNVDWNECVPGKCEIIDIKLKPSISATEIENFKCNDCQKYDTPICFVCKNAVSNKESSKRQNCNVAHCNKYYHLECLDHWPQTQFNGGEQSKNNKFFEAFTCPRHVCHTCVSDDPRGCKTRFSGDKLARCVRCPATYHSFTKCLPAGSQILTASHIICPRHHEGRPGKAPCHVNTGWCFICALGGSLICCEYCPTSFHAECLNIDPPEGGYMCEDCETGRLPLYGEMVWVKLGHYRWWPGIVLHPYEIPENLLTLKHSHGEFVVRFFGQYDHYWVNRGRVFPFQEGDSGRISTNKSKIDAAFITAVEHAQRACEILKTAQPNPEESLDIASSLLPPHYVKLKVNKPCGSLCGRKLEDPESSLTQCECNPLDDDPCGPYSQCLNRMLLTECGPTCRAGDRCNNRAFEKRLYPKLVPYRTPSRGWGLKTLEDIKAGQFVIEYVGELIDEEEFRRRMNRKHEIRDENFYFLTLDKERMIDAGPKGNLARFMNHCCEPNCETQKWTVLGDVRVGLFALYDIPAQSEVTFNYNLECAGIDKKRCMCGAKRCSGYIGAKPKQEESQSKKNKINATKKTYKKRKPEESPSTKSKTKRPIGRPPKPKELTEIEKDLLIIRNATNGLASEDSSNISTEHEKHPKALKRKRASIDEQNESNDVIASPEVKKSKIVDKLEGD